MRKRVVGSGFWAVSKCTQRLEDTPESPRAGAGPHRGGPVVGEVQQRASGALLADDGLSRSRRPRCRGICRSGGGEVARRRRRCGHYVAAEEGSPMAGDPVHRATIEAVGRGAWVSTDAAETCSVRTPPGAGRYLATHSTGQHCVRGRGRLPGMTPSRGGPRDEDGAELGNPDPRRNNPTP